MKYFLIDDFWQGDEIIAILGKEQNASRFRVIYSFYFARYYADTDTYIIYEKAEIEPSVLFCGTGHTVDERSILYDLSSASRRKTG